MTPARIVVVEDARVVARDIKQQLTRIGHEVVGTTASGLEAVALAGAMMPSLVLMDIRLEGAMDGIEAAQLIRDRFQIPVVYLTAYADEQTLRRATVTEPFGYLLKPFEDSQLRTVIEMALYKSVVERRLRASERRYAITLSSIADAVIATNEHDKITFMNAASEVLTGWTREEAIGRAIGEICHFVDEETRTPIGCPKDGLHRANAVISPRTRLLLVTRGGNEVPADFLASPIVDDDGSTDGAVFVVRDLTERRRASAAEEAIAANRAKDEFLANVSHEIRTPMNAIVGMTELVLDTHLTDGQRRSLETVHSAAGSLLGTINDLLDFSKIEAGKLELDPTEFQLRSVLGETLRALALRAHRKGLEVIGDVHATVPDALIGDAARLRQVLVNLVGNAIKFTNHGEVVVEVDLDPSTDAGANHVRLRFSVRDSGIGIPAHRQEMIFRAFEQEDTSTTRNYGGTGLGLTIAARLTELMGGEVSLTSEVGRGSVFTFTARFDVRGGGPTPEAPRSDLVDVRVLVVDNNRVQRGVVTGWLRRWGLIPTGVEDEVAAMDALWSGATAGSPFGLVLIDSRMPYTESLALAGRIRDRNEMASPRIILLTSGDAPGEVERDLDRFVDGQLTKPVPQDELREAIRAVLTRSRSERVVDDRARPTRTQSVATATLPLRILVAEDNDFNAQLARQLLASRGHFVDVVTTGQQALATLRSSPYDLLMLDLHMPELDGFDVMAAIRREELATGAHLAIVVVTARSRAEDRERCFVAGADEFLPKPIAASALWASIARMFATDLISARSLLSACGEDETILASICAGLRSRAAIEVQELHAALAADDGARLEALAHRLAGTFAAFSEPLSSLLLEIEERAARRELRASAPLVRLLHPKTELLLEQLGSLSLDGLRRMVARA